MTKFTNSKLSKFLNNFALVLGTLIVIITAVESISFFTKEESEPINCINCAYYMLDDRYGYVAIPNHTVETTQSCGEEPCYKATYKIDKFSRRSTGLDVKSDRHLLIFGCSNTFGVGLNDEDTLPYQIQKRTDAHVYNYAKGASGPNHALAVLESPAIQSQVLEDSGMAMYFLFEFHLERMSLSTASPWLWTTPAYEPDSSGQIQFVGSQAKAHPWAALFYQFYDKLRTHSYFFAKLQREFDVKTVEENESLLAAVLKKAKDVYEAKFHGRFVIVLQRNIADTLRKKLADNGLEIIQIDRKGGPENSRICKCDPHPNGLWNRFVAESLRATVPLQK